MSNYEGYFTVFGLLSTHLDRRLLGLIGNSEGFALVRIAVGIGNTSLSLL